MRKPAFHAFGFEIEWGFIFQTIGWLVVVFLLALNAAYSKRSAGNEDLTEKAVISDTAQSKASLDHLTSSVFQMRSQQEIDAKKVDTLTIQVKALAEKWNVKLPQQ